MPSASAAAGALRFADVEDATPISQQSRWLAQQMHEAGVIDRSPLGAGNASRTIDRVRQSMRSAIRTTSFDREALRWTIDDGPLCMLLPAFSPMSESSLLAELAVLAVVFTSSVLSRTTCVAQTP